MVKDTFANSLEELDPAIFSSPTLIKETLTIEPAMVKDSLANNLGPGELDPAIFSSPSLKKETLTIDEAVDRVVNKVTLRLVLMLLLITSASVNSGMVTYLTVFTGQIPYSEWKCVSKKCLDLKNTAKSLQEFFSEETMCKNGLVAGSDFEWIYKRQTFSMDWGFYCNKEAKLSLISSVLFVGMFLGLLFSTALFDRFGRKKVALIGSFLNLAAVAISSCANNFIILLLLRVLYGFGVIISYTGSYCWLVELLPERYRNISINFFSLGGWTTGKVVLIGFSYFINQWQYVYLAVAGVNALALLLFLVLPIPPSPRFSLIKGRKEEALKTLEILALASNNDVCLEKIDLVYEERKQSYLEQIKDFRSHPNMTRETLLGMGVWLIVSLVDYSYQFGWSKIGNDLHSIHLFVALGTAISGVIAVPLCRFLSRKKAILFIFVWVIVMNGIASLDVKFSSDWSLEHLASMLGSIGITTEFLLIYLLSGELAPTSHRGMIICLSSSCARIGSFLGPYVNLMYGVTDRRVPLALFAGLSFIACVAVWFLPDTTGRAVPETPGDVEILAEKERKEGRKFRKERKDNFEVVVD